MILKIQNFCEKKIRSLPAAGIRAQVFRLPVERDLFFTEILNA